MTNKPFRRAALAAVPAALAVAALLPAVPARAQTTTIIQEPDRTTQVTTTPRGAEIITVTVNNQPVEFTTARPMMMGRRVMVPVRGVFERLGGEILWDQRTRTVTGAEGDNKFTLRVGRRQAFVNGQRVPLDAPPRVVNGAVYVPLRFVSEAMGAKVVWDNTNRTVVVTDDGVATEVNAPNEPKLP
jgi:hypothetical protein